MATIKSHTDIEQSRKLSEILPLESADMYYWCGEDLRIGGHKAMDKDYDIPCWSLAALLGVLSFPALRYDIEDGEGGWIVGCEKNDKGFLSYYKDNPVDTCYEMILKLHEKKLI